MTTKKILIWSGVALAIGLGVFIAIKIKNKKEADEQAKKDAQDIIDAQNEAKQIYVAPKPKPITKPTTPPAPKALPPATLPKIGTKLFANGDMNTYKTPQAGVTNVYRYYPKGSYLGTFLATAGTPSGYYWKVYNELSGTSGTVQKEIYVIASQVKL